MLHHVFRVAVVTTAVFLSAASTSLTAQDALVIQNIDVIDVKRGQVVPGRTIVIENGSIESIGASDSKSYPDGAHIVDGSGRYLIPGLWDMHTHVLYEGVQERYFPMLVANGVTGVRDMNGPMPPAEVAALKESIAQGELVGPRIVTPFRLIDGPARSIDARGPETFVVSTTEEARRAVRELTEQGADFIKVYNSLPDSLLRTVLDETRRHGLRVAGHVPMTVRASDASNWGMASLEHLQGILEECTTAGEGLRLALSDGLAVLAQSGKSMQDVPAETIQAVIGGRQDLVNTFDEEACGILGDVFVRNETWEVPTLVSNRGVDLAAIDSTFQADPRLAFVPDSIAVSWEASVRRHPYRLDASGRHKRQNIIDRIVNLHYGQGVRFMAGTDLGVAYVYAGFSLHEELRRLVEAGLSNADALRAATINSAEYLGLSGRAGSIEPGNTADLVLLRANPLEDISNTETIDAVVLSGRLFERAELDEMLEKARQVFSSE
jgi:imidazolonepropionase-like amidohydrolase